MTLLVFTAFGCSVLPPRGETPPGGVGMRWSPLARVSLEDDMDFHSLKTAAEQNLEYLLKLDQSKIYRFGSDGVSVARMVASVERLIEIFHTQKDPGKRTRTIRDEFDIFTGAGRADSGNVMITGYYQPLLLGSIQKGGKFKWPLYRLPTDLVKVDLGLFSEKLRGMRVAGRVEAGRLIPYYNRDQIDFKGALSGKGLETVFVDDPIDVFFLHIQGSGVVKLTDGSSVFANYAGVNGREYRSIGKLMIEEGHIKRKDMSMQAIRRWLNENPDHLRRVLSKNPSYIFFHVMDDGPFGSTGARLTPGRSAAFDPRMIPKGAIAHVSFDAPILKKGEVSGFMKTARFVFNQDQGGAIKGAGRMDLFFGLGDGAPAKAGVMKHSGWVSYLVLKERVYRKRK